MFSLGEEHKSPALKTIFPFIYLFFVKLQLLTVTAGWRVTKKINASVIKANNTDNNSSTHNVYIYMGSMPHSGSITTYC